ncbi:HAMP domain-containing histidine kinase [Chitinophaga agrisoli]|uniref:histidine kinase n=1 Tax=Chitinophaga agrisoli TaxID=2607653 RepID=A0A5B2VXL7_9BACT|nr:HAMP domain-containing sensor histidine kinase [Chitinophaga agrisoli]KAA2243350.1 HAMP domain-containing histidine kinase [Chitinophaga agrisoli]
MRSFSAKYAYPLVVLSLLVSIALQVAWLRQLFVEQRARTFEDIEELVAVTAKNNIYKYVQAEPSDKSTFQQFLLSPAWMQIRQGFDDAFVKGMSRTFSEDRGPDSSVIELKFTFYTKPSHRPHGTQFWQDLPMDQKLREDSLSLIQMNKTVEAGLRKLGVTAPHYYLLQDYANNSTDVSHPEARKAAFVSKRYSYNLQHLKRYQLVVSAVDGLVWYKMRYYAASSILMLLLTGAAFYFILKLMRNQRLYAEARVAFTSNMTHEIKTPIATVALAIESINKYDLINDPVKLQTYLDISRQELQRLNLMVEKVLNLSQENSAEQYQLKPALYDVQTGLQEVISSMELQFAAKGASCTFTPWQEPCFVYADAVHLTNVFYNLIENAVKYADKPLQLNITCSCNDTEVKISFTDNGPGIEPIYHDRVFERYFRVPSGGDRHNVKGSGLGLNYVKHIIEAHKGAILLKSEAGKGSTFIINLPVAA